MDKAKIVQNLLHNYKLELQSTLSQNENLKASLFDTKTFMKFLNPSNKHLWLSCTLGIVYLP